tara:strand:- start:246 stop:449 length:204 start_codon:yes stop_codon:yes gene_type:complete
MFNTVIVSQCKRVAARKHTQTTQKKHTQTTNKKRQAKLLGRRRPATRSFDKSEVGRRVSRHAALMGR